MSRTSTMRVLLLWTFLVTLATADLGTPTMNAKHVPFAGMASSSSSPSSATANFFKSLPHPQQVLVTRSDKNEFGSEDYEDDDDKKGNKYNDKKDDKDKLIDDLFADFDKDKKKGQNLAALLGGGSSDQLSSVVSGALQTLGLPAGSVDSLLSSGSPLLQALLTSTALPGGDLAGLAGALGPLLPALASGGDLAGLAGALGPLLGGSDLAGLAGSLGPLLGAGSDLSGLAGSLGSLGGIGGILGAAGPLLGGADLSSLSGLAGALGGSDLSGLAGSLGSLGGIGGLAGAAAPFLGGSDLSSLAGSLGGLGGLVGAASPFLGGASGLGSLAGVVGSLVGRDASDSEKFLAAVKLDQMARQGIIDLDSIFATIVANGIEGSPSSSIDSLENGKPSSSPTVDNAALLALLQSANRPQVAAFPPSIFPTNIEDDEADEKPAVNQQALLSLLQGQQQQQQNRPTVASTVSSSSGADNGANLVQLAQVFSTQLAQILNARRSSLASNKRPAFVEDAKLLRSIADVLYPSKSV